MKSLVKVRYLVVLMAVVAVLCLAGCASNTQQAAESSSQETASNSVSSSAVEAMSADEALTLSTENGPATALTGYTLESPGYAITGELTYDAAGNLTKHTVRNSYQDIESTRVDDYTYNGTTNQLEALTTTITSPDGESASQVYEYSPAEFDQSDQTDTLTLVGTLTDDSSVSSTVSYIYEVIDNLTKISQLTQNTTTTMINAPEESTAETGNSSNYEGKLTFQFDQDGWITSASYDYGGMITNLQFAYTDDAITVSGDATATWTITRNADGLITALTSTDSDAKLTFTYTPMEGFTNFNRASTTASAPLQFVETVLALQAEPNVNASSSNVSDAAASNGVGDASQSDMEMLEDQSGE